MCGIAGVVSPHPTHADEQGVRAMIEALRHRGPDAQSVLALDGIVLGHSRLAVIDLSATANQPMADERYTIVYNGELYNYRELKRELADYRFRTDSDTEVILAAFGKWGEHCVDRFNGMFAFAIWDTETQRLFLARDRLGEKPLYWTHTKTGSFAFASEPDALTAHAEVSRNLDAQGLATYLRLNYTVGERTLYEQINRFPAGHCGWVQTNDRQPRLRRYWDLAACYKTKRDPCDVQTTALELNALIDDAVERRLVSDVPLGAFLSGGLDSSAIAASMVHAVGAGRTKTFSTGFAEASYDELEYAKAMAEYLGVDHIDQTVDHDLPTMMAQMDIAAREPLGDTSFLPMLMLAEMTRKHVTVALSGDGADEIFLGYPTYFADVYHRWSAPLLAPVQPLLMSALERIPVSFAKVSADYKARQWVSGLGLDTARAHCHWREIFAHEEAQSVLSGDVLQAGDFEQAEAVFTSHFRDVAECHYLDQASYVDVKTWLADDILVKVDRATMAHSLEARAPFLDHRIVEFAARLPVSHKLGYGIGKRVLRLGQRHRLPRRTLTRAKRGFNAPISAWFNGPLREVLMDTLSHPCLDGIINRTVLDQLIDEHAHKSRDHGLRLLSLYSLSRWLQA
jgi:asparagine synthase (glutamine-hydrolysing)